MEHHHNKKFNRFCNLTNGTTIVELTQGQWTILDTLDWEPLKGYKWYAQYVKHCDRFYAVASIPNGLYKQKGVRMHRIILGLSEFESDVDHDNRDSLDNRRENLRVDFENRNAQNIAVPSHNTSHYKNVQRYSCNQSRKKHFYWRAAVRVNRKVVASKLFPFTNEGKEKAAIWVDAALLEHHGEFAVTNKSLGLI